MQCGSPGPLGVMLPQRSTLVNPSAQIKVLEAVQSTCPAYSVWHPNKKGLAMEAFFAIWLPGPDSNQRPID